MQRLTEQPETKLEKLDRELLKHGDQRRDVCRDTGS